MPKLNRSIAIVGMGGIFPDAPELSRYWTNIREGICAARQVPTGRWHLDPTRAFDPRVGTADRVYSTTGCFLDPLPSAATLPGLALDPAMLEGLDPLFHLLLHGGSRAFNDGVTAPLDRSRIGVIIGNLALPSETSALLTRNWLGRTFEEKLLGNSSDPIPTSPLNRYVAGLPASILAGALGLGGRAFTLDAACASSLYAIRLAMEELLSGRADAMLTGGLSRPDPLFTQMGFSQLRALSKRGICSPFDARGDGLVVGEGCGMFLLKRLDEALSHGDRIYGIIRGVGLSNDVGGSLLAPMSEGQLRAMRPAYAAACWDPMDVDLIECHATGTPVGDGVEVASLRELWNGRATGPGTCVIGSVKSNIGHLLTAAGAAALTKVLLAMGEETLPPTASFTSPQPGMGLEKSPFRVLTRAEPWQRRTPTTPRRAAVSAFGFGGINAHLLVEEWLPEQREAFSVTAVQPEKEKDSDAVAIVGMDTHFGPWHGLARFRERVLGGDPAATPVEPDNWWGAEKSAWFSRDGFNAIPFSGFRLGEVAVEAGRFRIPPREMEEMLPQQLLMLKTAAGAMEDAGIGREGNARTGVFVGIALDLNSTNFSLRWQVEQRAPEYAALLGLNLTDTELTTWTREMVESCGPALTANRTMGALGNIVASRIAREFQAGGPSFTLSSEGNSGISALETAVRLLGSGELDRALVGAVDLAGDLRAVLGEQGALSASPSGSSLSLDQREDGTVGGEGAVALVLKRLSDAERDGDRIYAVVRGIGSAGGKQESGKTGGRGDGETDKPGDRVEPYLLALERSYTEAGIEPSRIGYLETAACGIADSDYHEARLLTRCFGSTGMSERSCAVGNVGTDIGQTGAVAGLASVARACLTLYQEIIPPFRDIERLSAELGRPFYAPPSPRYWLHDRADGERLAAVSSRSIDGSCCHVVLEGHTDQPSRVEAERFAPLGPLSEQLFLVRGETTAILSDELDLLLRQMEHTDDLGTLSRSRLDRRSERQKGLTLAMVARNREELRALIDQARVAIEQGSVPDTQPGLRDRLFYSPAPLGRQGTIAFVFPGSGNHYSGMALELSSRWPELFRRQQRESLYLKSQFQPELFWNGAPSSLIDDDHRAVIFGQVTTGCIVSDAVAGFGIRPRAAIGYSLGESAALFSQRAWTDRDGMFSRMGDSDLFTRDLAGECRAARTVWGVGDNETVSWSIGVADAPRDEVRQALEGISRAYLLIVNTPHECVIGGDSSAVERVVERLGCRFFPLSGVTTVHCEVARPVAEAYHDLHLFPTTPPEGVTWYSGSWGRSFPLTRENAAASILANALEGIDYPKTIESAYADGVRIFLEMGPGASCSRMISRILEGRPHLARSACWQGQDPVSSILRLVANLAAEGVAVDLAPLLRTAPEKQLAVTTQSMVRLATGGAPFVPPAVPASANASRRPASPGAGASPAPQPDRTTPAPSRTQHNGGAPQHSLPIQGAANSPIHLAEEKAASPIQFAQEGAAPQTPFPQGGPASQIPFPLQGGGRVGDGVAPATQPTGGASSLLDEFQRTQQEQLGAHEAFLSFSDTVAQTMAQALALEMSLRQALGDDALAVLHEESNRVDDHSGCSKAARSSHPQEAPRRLVGATPCGRPGQAHGPAPTPPHKWATEDGGEMAAFQRPAKEDGGEMVALQRPVKTCAFDRDLCLEFARGSVAAMLGPAFAEVDTFPTRVRLPDEPLMLVDRILSVEGEPRSMTSGRVITEHDILPNAWYLDGGRIPTCIAVESGQADLFLSGYLGIDFITRGLAVYRLLDAVVTFHRALPGPGETIHYDIRIERFFRQGDTYLFRFFFEATVNDQPLLSMRDGCAGFFTAAELDAGKGIVRPALDLRPTRGILPPDWRELVPMGQESYTAEQLDRLRRGDLAGCFGVAFAGLPLAAPLTIPGGSMRMVHRVIELDPHGGRCGIGIIRAEADIRPDDWFLTCHFVDDRVMPGTLMYECCMHTLRIYLLRLGWIAEGPQAVWEPVPGVASKLCCRGQVLETTRTVTYEVTIRELGYGPEPYAIVDALMYADGKPIVEITSMSARLSGTTRERLEAVWQGGDGVPSSADIRKPAIYTKEQILAYSNGKPSEGFGEHYRIFDSGRKIARLPGPPFQFMDRVTAVKGEPWQMTAGAMAEAQYDVPVDAWYFGVERQGRMPFSVLLEAALQPCGWLAAYVGSALTSPVDISFRNLGGNAIQHRPVTPDSGTLTATATMKKVATSGGMIIQEFDFSVADQRGVLYEGETMFGFFSKEALANQVGIRDGKPYQPSADEAVRGRSLPYPHEVPFPDSQLRMIDEIELYVADGGPAGLGYIQGIKHVDPEEWFFTAHFYEDPVTPGSLGLESFLQLVKFAAVERWGYQPGDVLETVALGRKHRWLYRGQIVPTNSRVTVTAWITAVDEGERILTAAGFLSVDGKLIYQMNDFTVRMAVNSVLHLTTETQRTQSKLQ